MGQPSKELINFLEYLPSFSIQKGFSLVQQVHLLLLWPILSFLGMAKLHNNPTFPVSHPYFLKPHSFKQINEVQVLLRLFLAKLVIFNVVNILILPENTFYVQFAPILISILREQLIERPLKVILPISGQKLINILNLMFTLDHMHPAPLPPILPDLFPLAILLLASLIILQGGLNRVHVGYARKTHLFSRLFYILMLLLYQNTLFTHLRTQTLIGRRNCGKGGALGRWGWGWGRWVLFFMGFGDGADFKNDSNRFFYQIYCEFQSSKERKIRQIP